MEIIIWSHLISSQRSISTTHYIQFNRRSWSSFIAEQSGEWVDDNPLLGWRKRSRTRKDKKYDTLRKEPSPVDELNKCSFKWIFLLTAPSWSYLLYTYLRISQLVLIVPFNTFQLDGIGRSRKSYEEWSLIWELFYCRIILIPTLGRLD